MTLVRRLRNLYRFIVRSKRVEQEFDEELHSYLQIATDENLRKGQQNEDAERNARLELGGIEQIKELDRAARPGFWMDSIAQDLRYALRSFSRTPGFTIVVVLTLALGIGANTTIFSVIDAVLLRPLPYAEPDRLVTVLSVAPPVRYVPMDVLAQWDREPEIFEQIGGHRTVSRALTGGMEPVFASGEAVSSALLSLLGVTPQMGRLFLPEEGAAGNERVVIISDRLWRRQFGAEPGIIGTTIQLTGEPHMIVGVMPPGFRFPREAQDFWIPLSLDSRDGSTRLEGIGRLRPGLDIAAAGEVIGRITKRFNQEQPIAGDWGISLQPLGSSRLNPGPKRAMFIVFGAVGFVLLIAAVNTTNLLLSRSAARKAEMAMRAALGAGRWRLLRQLLTESLCLAALGAVGGVLLSIWGVQAIMRNAPTFLTFWNVDDVAVNGRVLLFTLGVSVATGLVCGLLPGLTIWWSDLNPAIRLNAGRGSPLRGRFGSFLIAAEVGLSVVLLVGAGLLMRSFVRMTNVSMGFDAGNVLVTTTLLMGDRYRAPVVRDAFFRELQQRVAALPGVTGVTVAISLPPDGGFTFDVEIEPEGQAVQPVQGRGRIGFNHVADNFFDVMGIPILRGRIFGREDTPEAPRVIVVSRTMAERFWPNVDPVGRRLRFGNNEPWLTVVGVAADVGRRGLDARDYVMDYYESAAQNGWSGQMTLITRDAANAATLVPLIKKEIWAVDPNEPIVSIRAAGDVLADSTAEPRFYLLLMSIFAASAMLLAAVGIYGVVSHAVVQRTAEIGIRLSLGAQRTDVFRLVVARVIGMTAIGLVLGLLGALALTGLLAGLLFEVSAADPLTFMSSVLVLCSVALIGAGVPAFRATRVDPLIALRSE